MSAGQDLSIQPVVVAGMHHHRRVDALERAFARHQLLAAAAFFGRCAKKAHTAGQLVAQLGESQCRAQPRCSDQIVAAGVADPGQCVILSQDRDARRIRSAELALESGVQAVGAACYGEAMPLHRLGQPHRCLLLVKSQLRLGVNRPRNADQLDAHRIDGLADRHASDRLLRSWRTAEFMVGVKIPACGVLAPLSRRSSNLCNGARQSVAAFADEAPSVALTAADS